MANMDARQIRRIKMVHADGSIIEIVVWKVPKPVPGSAHLFKYRLFFGFPGTRVIGYDNERGKGDHRHRGEIEEPYAFVSPEQLFDDFAADIERWRTDRANDDDQRLR